MKRRLPLVLVLVLVLVLGILDTRAEAQAPTRPQNIADAITELDVERARELLEKADASSPTLAFERARLAIYVGDCDTAAAILAAPEFSTTPEGSGLGELARSCAKATAASLVVDDKSAGVWIRLQDEADRVLVPFLTDVAVRARDQVAKDLGVDLPRPLRIDLVRDLFSLSAVSGLPLTAAETTGTVAVARWGRVTMISPRATLLGYPWEDTLAHEITHLALSRGTRDRAPLWLQEGIAKREETRWRAPRAFDSTPSADSIARAALKSGRSVGVDKLGPSIAMLPTPEAASIAFSEVTSFVAFWIDKNGDAALRLLFRDLKGLGGDDPNGALRSVTGYDLAEWIVIWQRALLDRPDEPPAKPAAPAEKVALVRERDDPARRVRLGDLLFARGHSKPAATEHEAAMRAIEHEAALRWRLGRSLLGAEQNTTAKDAVGRLEDIRGVHGGWQALSGRFKAESGDRAGAEDAFRQGIAVDPLSEDVACEGFWTPRGAVGGPPPPLPVEPRRRALCEAARALPRD